jgi:membrane-bound metal-dependent hydrolase YbcI (DUF457 family)
MTLFDWLLIGHLIGDWAFQNEWMVRHKQDALFNRAVFVHCGIYTLVLLVVLWLTTESLSSGDFLLFGVVVYVSHWLIDATNAAEHWMHIFQQSNVLFVRIVVDQAAHLLILGLLIEFLLT